MSLYKSKGKNKNKNKFNANNKSGARAKLVRKKCKFVCKFLLKAKQKSQEIKYFWVNLKGKGRSLHGGD